MPRLQGLVRDLLEVTGMLHARGLLGEAGSGLIVQCNAARLCWQVLTTAAAQPAVAACWQAWPLAAKPSLCTASVAEYAEYRLFAPLSPTAKQDRMSKWQQLGQRHPKLQECILKANPSWSAHSIPDR